MSGSGFAFPQRFRKTLPPPALRWNGFPKYNFIGGHNDPTQIPTAELAEAASAVLHREAPNLALYNMGHGPQGYPGLRDFVVGKVARRRGIECGRDDVMITSGSGQGLDLVNRLFLEPGDTVIFEEYSYGGAITKVKGLGVNIIGAPLDGDGIRIDALSAILDDLAAKGITPKYIYTIPTIQNPTGSILPLDRRQALLALARKHGVPIFEDECYADLIWAGTAVPPALYALDPTQVIHIGSFSKSLAPALRLGYVVASWDILSRMIPMKTDSGTEALAQMVVAEYFGRKFDAHVEALSAILHDKLATMVDAVEREFGTAAELWRPKGGIFLWLKLPDAVDVRKLVQPATAAGIAFNPGPEWSCSPEASASQLRLCFALPSKEEIREGVAALARVCYETTGIPAQSANIRRQSA